MDFTIEDFIFMEKSDFQNFDFCERPSKFLTILSTFPVGPHKDFQQKSEIGKHKKFFLSPVKSTKKLSSPKNSAASVITENLFAALGVTDTQSIQS